MMNEGEIDDVGVCGVGDGGNMLDWEGGNRGEVEGREVCEVDSIGMV